MGSDFAVAYCLKRINGVFLGERETVYIMRTMPCFLFDPVICCKINGWIILCGDVVCCRKQEQLCTFRCVLSILPFYPIFLTSTMKKVMIYHETIKHMSLIIL